VSIVILKGEEAIHYAAAHNKTLNMYATASEGARAGLTVEEADEIAYENPGLIWIETHIKLNSGDPSEQE